MCKQSRIAALALFLALASTAVAQTVSSSLLGTVVDPSGAAVPGVEVQLVYEETGSPSSTLTNALGLFRFPILPPGVYRLTIQAKGFKAYKEEAIDLT